MGSLLSSCLFCCNEYIPHCALSLASHCFALVFHHFGGKVAGKYARTNTTERRIYFALPRITLNANNVLIRQLHGNRQKIEMFLCAWFHEEIGWLQWKCCTTVNWDNPIVSFCSLFCSTFVLVAVAIYCWFSWFSNPSDCIWLHCEYSAFAIWAPKPTYSGREIFSLWCLLFDVFMFFSSFLSIETNRSERICRFINKLG